MIVLASKNRQGTRLNRRSLLKRKKIWDRTRSKELDTFGHI